MKNKNILALVLVLCISLSMMGCGKTNTKDNTENVVATEIQDTENVQETEKNEEPKYTEHETYFLEDGVKSEGNQYDMNTMKPSDKKYTLTKSVDIYYLNEKKCGYTKENIDIQIITSNDDYCYVNLEHKYFLMKTKDVGIVSGSIGIRDKMFNITFLSTKIFAFIIQFKVGFKTICILIYHRGFPYHASMEIGLDAIVCNLHFMEGISIHCTRFSKDAHGSSVFWIDMF